MSHFSPGQGLMYGTSTGELKIVVPAAKNFSNSSELNIRNPTSESLLCNKTLQCNMTLLFISSLGTDSSSGSIFANWSRFSSIRNSTNSANFKFDLRFNFDPRSTSTKSGQFSIKFVTSNCHSLRITKSKINYITSNPIWEHFRSRCHFRTCTSSKSTTTVDGATSTKSTSWLRYFLAPRAIRSRHCVRTYITSLKT